MNRWASEWSMHPCFSWGLTVTAEVGCGLWVVDAITVHVCFSVLFRGAWGIVLGRLNLKAIWMFFVLPSSRFYLGFTVFPLMLSVLSHGSAQRTPWHLVVMVCWTPLVCDYFQLFLNFHDCQTVLCKDSQSTFAFAWLFICLFVFSLTQLKLGL